MAVRRESLGKEPRPGDSGCPTTLVCGWECVGTSSRVIRVQCLSFDSECHSLNRFQSLGPSSSFPWGLSPPDLGYEDYDTGDPVSPP